MLVFPRFLVTELFKLLKSGMRYELESGLESTLKLESGDENVVGDG